MTHHSFHFPSGPSCIAITCQNGGLCIDRNRVGSCNCTIGYSGNLCQTGITKIFYDIFPSIFFFVIDINNNNNNSNNNVSHTIVFSCPSGPSCAAMSCLNNGTCNNTNGVGACSCSLGYSGSHCQTGNIKKYFLRPKQYISSHVN